MVRTKTIISIIMITITLMLSSCTLADNVIIAEKVSPDGKYIAVMFNRNAGATTGNNYQISIITNGTQLPNDGGNVFISYSKADFEWRDNQTLVISTMPCDTIFKQKEKHGKVNVVYNYFTEDVYR